MCRCTAQGIFYWSKLVQSQQGSPQWYGFEQNAVMTNGKLFMEPSIRNLPGSARR